MHYDENCCPERIYLALIFILLYAPIVTLIVLSFNASVKPVQNGAALL